MDFELPQPWLARNKCPDSIWLLPAKAKLLMTVLAKVGATLVESREAGNLVFLNFRDNWHCNEKQIL